MVTLVGIFLILLSKKINEQIKNHENFYNELRLIYSDFHIDESKDVDIPEVSFSDKNYYFRIFNKLKKRRKYVSIYDEFIELTPRKAKNLDLMIKKMGVFLSCEAKNKDGVLLANISKLKDYDRLLNFLKNYENEKIF